jgi:hypothetical protein
MASAGLTLQIDYREKDIYDMFKKVGGVPDYILLDEPCNLDIGDIIISTVTGDQIIIERKRFDDLSSSIKDGRYDEQKMRCMAHMQQQQGAGYKCILVYLLEGDLSYCRNSADANMALGAWISMEMRDRVPVVRVLNMEEGVKWIYRLCDRIRKKPGEIFKVDKPQGVIIGSGACSAAVSGAVSNATEVKTIYLGGGTHGLASDSNIVNGVVNGVADDSNIKQVTQSEYLGTIKTKKKENITPETCAQVMLAVIPGMTSETAKIVLDVFGNGTLVGLINALSVGESVTDGVERDTAIKEKKKNLAAIQVKPGRKLGPALAEKIWDYLFAAKK